MAMAQAKMADVPLFSDWLIAQQILIAQHILE